MVAGPGGGEFLAAFEIACSAGYGIELDVRLSADGEAVVFHDETLERMTGADGLVSDLTAASSAPCPCSAGRAASRPSARRWTWSPGRAMLLVEIKAGDGEDGGGALEARVAELLRRYEGPCAVISFDAAALGWFARHRRHIPARPRRRRFRRHGPGAGARAWRAPERTSSPRPAPTSWSAAGDRRRRPSRPISRQRPARGRLDRALDRGRG
ncbi:MAG: glycerophosphodiester phosphodiesterase family protein [Caulobacteraceae bacterium]